MAGIDEDKPKHQMTVDTVRQHLDANNLADAGATLSAGLERWPGHMRLHLMQGELLERTGETEAALSHYREVQEKFADAPWPSVPLARLLSHTGKRQEARDLFAERIWPSAMPDKSKNAILHQLTSQVDDIEDAEAFLEAFVADDPHPIPLVRLAGIRMKRHSPEKALEALEQAAERAGDVTTLPDHAQSMLLDLRITALRMEAALPLAEQLYKAHPDQPEIAGKLVRILSELGKQDRAGELLADALDRWPGDLQLIRRYNRLHLPPERDAAIFALLEARAGDPDTDPRWCFQYALACLQTGHIEATLETLHDLRDDLVVGEMAKPLEAALLSRPISMWRPRDGFDDDRGKDTQVVPSPGADTTLVVFAGLMGRLSYLPFSCVDAMFADRGVNIVFLRDRYACGYLRGVAGLGSSEPETLERLTDILRDLGTAKLITLGASMGGYAAMRYGAQLRAGAAISLDGPTTIDSVPGTETVESGVSPRFDGFMRMIRTALSRELDGKPSLAACLAEAPSTQVYHCYGADYPQEAIAAERLGDFANVHLMPVAGVADHYVGLHMIARGELDLLCAKLLDTPPGTGQ